MRSIRTMTRRVAPFFAAVGIAGSLAASLALPVAAQGLRGGLSAAASASPGQNNGAARHDALNVMAVPTLRSGVTALGDVLTLGDLVAGLAADLAREPVFRAPALGETGTIQSHRVLDALRARGVDQVRDRGVVQVVVTRAARRIEMREIEAAIRQGLEARFGLDARQMVLSLDQGAPQVAVEPDLSGEIAAQDLSYDPRSRRVSAVLTLAGSHALKLKPVRIVGQMMETTDVVLLQRPVARGEIVASQDIITERRPREGMAQDLATEPAAVIGKSARRALQPGQPLRLSDLQRHEIIARNEIVTAVFEAPGLVLTMRGRANEAGALGDLVTVQNLTSKKIVQGVVTGPGRIAVNGVTTGPVAQSSAPSSARPAVAR